jgi:ParB family chromosome partitioning protein
MKHKIETISIDDLIPYVNNARTHDEAQVAQIAASIKEFGFNNPILIDSKSGIIAGHGRLAAARKLGLKEVPAIRLDHLTDVQRKAYIIADNKLALNAGWDFELLRLELSELDIDLDLIGFDEKELADILGNAEITGLPELPDGDKSVLEQITFTLHREQAETIKNAMAIVKKDFDITNSLNDNSNGNAIAFIAELFITQNALS